MDNAMHLGLDVHKEAIAVAILRPGQHHPDERVIPNTPEALRSLVRRRRSAGRLVACYEAGPTGYDTYRLLSRLAFRATSSPHPRSQASWPSSQDRPHRRPQPCPTPPSGRTDGHPGPHGQGRGHP